MLESFLNVNWKTSLTDGKEKKDGVRDGRWRSKYPFLCECEILNGWLEGSPSVCVCVW